MGNCCSHKPQPKRKVSPNSPIKYNKQETAQNVSQQQQSAPDQIGLKQDTVQVKVPNLPKKKRVKETVKMVQSLDADGNKILNEYILQETLGRGAFGKVKRAVQKSTGQTYAVKILKKSQLQKRREFFVDDKGKRRIKSALDDVRREIAIMKKLNHENVVKLYEVIENSDEDKIYMVMDFADDGQLIDWDEEDQKWIFLKEDHDKDFGEEQIKNILRQCVCGLNYLHKHNIIHRDIKPQNILFKNFEKTALLGDFGVSMVAKGGDDTLTNTQGTYFFMSPESLDKDQSSKGYSGKAADIWSLGISMYCFAYKQQPINAEDYVDYMDKIHKTEIQYPSQYKYSEGFKNLLKQMLIKNPQKRITLDQIAQDKWINEGHENQPLSELMHVNKLEEVNEEDIRMALQLSTIIRIKTWVQKWKSSRRLSNNLQKTIIDETHSQNFNHQNSTLLNPQQVNILSN